MSKTIRVEEDTHAALIALKAEDESFDDLLRRLLRERNDSIRAGAGHWAESDAAARARDARTDLKDDLEP